MEPEGTGGVCAVLACRKRIAPGETYYALGGLGQVTTCDWCATQSIQKLVVNGKDASRPRAWDKTACVKSIKRVMT